MKIQYKLRRTFKTYMEVGTGSEDWNMACIIPIYERRGDKSECSNFRHVCRSVTGCVDRVFVLEIQKKIKKLNVKLEDLGKLYDKVCIKELGRELYEYGVEKYLEYI